MPIIFKMTPATRIALWFVTAIAIGAVLLALPISSEGGSLKLIDAVFTATSAVCVTGLTVVNTSTTFSTFGEIVIMILMQLGGLGVMIFSTMFFLAIAERLTLSHRMTVKEVFAVEGETRVKSILKATLIMTFTLEAIGTVLLFIPFSESMSLGTAIYNALFHSISGFCNAGFTILENGVSEYHNNIVLLLSLSFLIIAGGIGFSVAAEAANRLRNLSKRTQFSLHTKLVFAVTGILLLFGTICYYFFERNAAFASYPVHMKIIHSFFQSVTTRTAGFDPVNQVNFTNIGILISVFLMIIGASPGSTGGGIKTTSFAIIAATVVSRIRGSSGVNIFKRTVGSQSVIKAVSIFILAAVMIFFTTIILMLVEYKFVPHAVSRELALDYFFETVSAFGNVGLSLGITPTLSAAGKFVIVLAMFIGRVGLLTLAYLISRPEGSDRIVYSEENVMVG
jgi:trk system potassium uptake protein TrkH